MEWYYDGDGMWHSSSCFHDDGNPFCWQITITSDGEFCIEGSTSELLPLEKVEDFKSLESAKEFCENAEKSMLESYKGE
jgi:hypothetical protein